MARRGGQVLARPVASVALPAAIDDFVPGAGARQPGLGRPGRRRRNGSNRERYAQYGHALAAGRLCSLCPERRQHRQRQRPHAHHRRRRRDGDTRGERRRHHRLRRLCRQDDGAGFLSALCDGRRLARHRDEREFHGNEFRLLRGPGLERRHDHGDRRHHYQRQQRAANRLRRHDQCQRRGGESHRRQRARRLHRRRHHQSQRRDGHRDRGEPKITALRRAARARCSTPTASRSTPAATASTSRTRRMRRSGTA